MSENLPIVEEKREVHLLDYWRTISRGRWTVLSVFVVIVTLVAIGTFTQKPIYKARATVEITSQASKVAPVADVSQLGTSNYGWFAEERYFNTQNEIIKSRDVAQRVFDRLDLYHHPMFRNASDPVGMFSSMVQVELVKDTGIMEITLDGPDPKEVQTWVNSVAEAYVDRNLDLSIEATGRAVKALLSEIAPLREKLQDTQRSSFELAEKENLYVPENQQKITNDRLSTLQSDFTETQVKRSEIESVLKRIDDVRQSGGSYEVIPQISGDAVDTKRIYDLISARVKEIDLSASLLNNNLRILDHAPLPRLPVKPRPLLNLAVGVILCLLLGVGAVFFLDYMDNTVRTSEDVE